MPPALVIFDCDGVLVDSEALAASSLSDAMGELGLATDSQQVDERFRGKSLSDCLLAIEEELGRTLPRNFLADLNARTYASFERELRPIEGVREVIETLRTAGIPICVASSGSVEKMRLTLGLTGLLPLLEPHLFSSSMVARGKPSPDLFLFAASEMGHSISDAAVVEDSVAGMTGAREAGARVLSFVSSDQIHKERTREAAEQLGASVFSEMPQLLSLLGL